MRIDHIALCVRDLEAMRDFYIKHFGAAAGELYHNPRTGFSSYFLSFEGGARLELMTRPGLGAAGEFDLDRSIERGLEAGKAPSALAKELARASGLSRREVYGRICSRT